jgi:Rhodanese-like domain
MRELTPLVIFFCTFFTITIGTAPLPSTAQKLQTRPRQVVISDPTPKITEDQFIQAMEEKGVFLLDVRSRRDFKILHISGAVNLPFKKFNHAKLAAIIPHKNSKIIIYGYKESTEPSRVELNPAGNIIMHSSSHLAYFYLKSLGYTNIYELETIADTTTTKIPLAGIEIERANRCKLGRGCDRGNGTRGIDYDTGYFDREDDR